MKLVKQLDKFTFDKTIYVDRMIEANQGRISGIRSKTLQYKEEINQLKNDLETLCQNKVNESL